MGTSGADLDAIHARPPDADRRIAELMRELMDSRSMVMGRGASRAYDGPTKDGAIRRGVPGTLNAM